MVCVCVSAVMCGTVRVSADVLGGRDFELSSERSDGGGEAVVLAEGIAARRRYPIFETSGSGSGC